MLDIGGGGAEEYPNFFFRNCNVPLKTSSVFMGGRWIMRTDPLLNLDITILNILYIFGYLLHYGFRIFVKEYANAIEP